MYSNYFGFTPASLAQTGANYQSNPMSSGTVGMGTLSGMASPMMQMADNSSYMPQIQQSQVGGGAQNGSMNSNLIPQLLALQQMQQMGGRSSTPQSGLGTAAQMMPSLMGMMAQNPDMMSSLGGLMGAM